MISGVLLLVLTGICWVLIAVVISLAAHRGLDLDFGAGRSCDLLRRSR